MPTHCRRAVLLSGFQPGEPQSKRLGFAIVQSVSDIWRITTTLTGLPGLPGISTLFWERSDGEEPIPGTRDPADVLDEVGDFWDTLCTGGGSGSGGLATGLVATTSAVFTRLDSDNGEAIAFDSGGTDRVANGNGTGERIPYANQGLIRWHTGHFRRGRELKGHTFIPGLTEDHVTSGVTNTAFQTFAQGAADGIVGEGLIIWGRPIEAQTVEEHPPHGVEAADGDFASVSFANVWDKVAVLRSRRD